MPCNSPPVRMLVTGMGGAAGVAFVRALDDAAEVFTADMDRHAAGRYLVPAERRLLVPAGSSREFVPVLLELCRTHRIQVLVPTVDAELLPIAAARDAFERAGTRVLLASAATLELCLDKEQLLVRCQGIVPVPRFARFDAGFCADGWSFPVILKPRSGSGGRGVRLVTSRVELDQIPRDPGLLVQAYLPGEEYSVDVLAGADGRIHGAVPRVRLKVDSGVAVAARTLPDGELINLAAKVARRIGLTYVANIQFRRAETGEPALLEVNARFPGTMSLTVASGINMPRLAVAAVLGKPSGSTAMLPFRELAMVRVWEEVFLPPRVFDVPGPTPSVSVPALAMA